MDLVPFLRKPYKKFHVNQRVVGWSAGRHLGHHVGGKFRHGLLEKSLIKVISGWRFEHTSECRLANNPEGPAIEKIQSRLTA